MNDYNPFSHSRAETLIRKPIRGSLAAVALALMTSLALNGVVSNVYSLHAEYVTIIASQEAQLAAVAAATKRRPAVATEEKVEYKTPQASNRIIVQYKEGVKLPPGLSVATERANLEKAQGLVKLSTIAGINADVYQVSDDDSAQEVVDRLLATKGDVLEYAEVDMLVPPDAIPNDPSYGTQWHHPKVVSPTAWDSATGEGVIIGIADSGVDCTHPDLVANCVPGWNVYANTSDTKDTSGHGTKVAGTAAEVGDNGVGAVGVAPRAKIMPLQITNGVDTWAYHSDMAKAVVYAADNGARVVNISYGGACAAASVTSAASYMRSKGGVVTASAGNSGADNAMAASSLTTCVSATGSGDTRTSWSSWGASVDVAAPGASIYTTVRGGGYGGVNGTSFSAPLTAGIYALLFSVNPALTPTQADNILITTADDLGEAGWDMYYGHGRVNAAKAVAAAVATVGAKDTTPPSTPTALAYTNLTASSVTLNWAAATDDNSGVVGYSVYRDGVKLATVAGTSYSNAGLSPRTTYTYTIRAEDAQGNISRDSTPLSLTTPDVAFGIASYSVPTKTATSAALSVTLTKAGTVTVKYGTSATNLTGTLTSASSSVAHTLSLAGLTAATTYYYQVTATDGATTVTSPVSNFKTPKAAGGAKGGPKR